MARISRCSNNLLLAQFGNLGGRKSDLLQNCVGVFSQTWRGLQGLSVQFTQAQRHMCQRDATFFAIELYVFQQAMRSREVGRDPPRVDYQRGEA